MEEKVKRIVDFITSNRIDNYVYEAMSNAFAYMCGAYPDMKMEEAWLIWKEVRKNLFD